MLLLIFTDNDKSLRNSRKTFKENKKYEYELYTTWFHEFQIPNSQFQESSQFSASAISI